MIETCLVLLFLFLFLLDEYWSAKDRGREEQRAWDRWMEIQGQWLNDEEEA